MPDESESPLKPPGSPVVSVVIPTFNRSLVLGRALRSVLDQTYQKVEVIVVDDGSEDGTIEVIRAFKDDRVRYIKHERNQGQAAARNTGIWAAKGQYIAFQDSDDEWLPGKLERQVKLFEASSENVGVVYTEHWATWEDGRLRMSSRKIERREGDIRASVLRGGFIAMPTAMVRTEIVRKFQGFDVSLRHLEDWDLWIRLSREVRFRYIPEPLVILHASKDGASFNQQALAQALEAILRKHSGEFASAGRKVLAMQYYYLGSVLWRNGDTRRGTEYMLRAARAFPLNPKYLIAVVACVLGLRPFQRLDRIREAWSMRNRRRQQAEGAAVEPPAHDG